MTSDRGRILRSSDTAVITFLRTLDHDIDVVGAALTQAPLISRWLAPVDLDGRVDGHITLDFGGGADGIVTGRILVWEPPGAIEHQWNFPGEQQSVVRYELTAGGATTELELTHRRLGVAYADGYLAGWHAYLDRLTALLDGTTVPDWDERVASVQAEYR